MIRTMLSVALLSALATSALHAQEAGRGRADLRYTGPMPAKLSYMAVDSMEMVNRGMPTGEMTVKANVRAVVDLDITTAAAGVRMKAQIKEFGGNVETPMGSMPFPGTPPQGSTEFDVGVKGLDLKKSFEDAKKAGLPSGGMDMNAVLGRSREVAPLLILPGRELALKETWTDTVTHTDSIQGMQININMIVRGTYERDTVVSGRTLNVLVIRNDMKMTSSGTMQGQQMQQTVNTSSVEQALWDSRQHALVLMTGTSDVNMDVAMTGMNMSMTGKMKTVKKQVE